MISKEKWKHVVLIAFIVLIGYFQVGEWYKIDEMPYRDSFSGYYPRAQILRESIFEHGNLFPLWEPYLMSGSPYLDASSYDIISYIGILNLILPNAFMVVGVSYILAYVVIGVTMYILCLYLFKNWRPALFSALAFMLSGYSVSRFNQGGAQIYALSVMPLAFLFLVKIFREKEWIKNTVICGIIVAIQIKFSPAIRVTLLTSLIFALYLAFQLIGKKFLQRLFKVGVVGLILGIVIFGLTAHYVIPQKKLIDESSRGSLSFEQSSSRRTGWGELFTVMVESFHEDFFRVRYINYHEEDAKWPDRSKAGIIVFLLAAFAIYKKPKNKFVWFLLAVTLICILFVTGSWFFYFLWRYVPPWDSFRYVRRGFLLWAFSASLLAGIGVKSFLHFVKKKWNKKTRNIVFSVLIILLLLNLVVFVRHPINMPRCDFHYLLENAHGLNYINEIKEETGEIFRTHDWETRGIDWPTDQYTIGLGLEHIFGYFGAWQPEYMNVYLGFAFRDPAKYWGLLNVKYVTARDPINVSGLKLVEVTERFESDGTCPPPDQAIWNDPDADAAMKAFGNYIYENEEVLPRAFVVDNAILVVGSPQNIVNLKFAIMEHPDFDPKNTVVIQGKTNVNEYSADELSRYDLVFLTPGSVDQNSVGVLQSYVSSGGSVLPDIINGRTDIANEELDSIIQSFEGELRKVPDENVVTHSFEKNDIINPGEEGFLVISERYAMYNGWSVERGGKNLDIMRSDGVISSVYLGDSTGDLHFVYRPTGYLLGVWISIISVIGLIVFFVMRWHLKKKSK